MSKIIATAEVENKGEHYLSAVTVRQHHLVVDEPEDSGGKDTGPAPGDFLCAALASCTAITLRMYAERKQWKVETIWVKVNLVKGEDLPSGNSTFFCEVRLTGELDEAQHRRMMEIAKKCPIHRLLTKPSEVVTVCGETATVRP